MGSSAWNVLPLACEGSLGTAAPEGCGMVTLGLEHPFIFSIHCFGYLTEVPKLNINRKTFWSSDILNFCFVSELLPYFTASSSF